MTLGVLVVCAVLALLAGAAFGTFAARQLGPGEGERKSVGRRAREAAARGLWRFVARRREREE
jgi:hypothetical protein